MRLFVALDVGERARAGIARGLSSLRARAPEAKWVPPENLHLTVAFLGHLDGAVVPALCEALDEVTRRHPPLVLTVGGLGAFGARKHPRVLWVGARDHAPPALEALVGAVETRLGDFGYRKEERPYHPHVTLARARAPRGDPKLAALAGAEGGPLSRGQVVEVATVDLMQSTTAPTGARYARLHAARLGRPRSA